MKIGKFNSTLKKLDKNKISEEIFKWLTGHIDNYIDNHEFEYSICFLADPENLPETYKIEELITKALSESSLNKKDQETEEKFFESLYDYMDEIKEIMSNDEINKQVFLDKFLYYFSIVGIDRISSDVIVDKKDGDIDIKYLAYEADSANVTLTEMIEIKDDDGEIVNYKKSDDEVQVGTMPSSFVIDFEVFVMEAKNESSVL